MNHLSFARRYQLVQSTLNQIPNYQMRIFLLPRKIHTQFDKINKNFLWVHSDTIRRMHLVGWDKIIKSKTNGSLGIKKGAIMNAAFMTKLRWDLEINKQKTWTMLFFKNYNYPNRLN